MTTPIDPNAVTQACPPVEQWAHGSLVEAAQAVQKAKPTAPECAIVEYLTDVRLFVVDDGERHTYAARFAWDALAAHGTDFDCDCDEVTIRRMPPDHVLVVSEDDTYDETRARYPEAFNVTHDERYGTRITSTAAEWAMKYAESVKQAGTWQVCSSVY